MKNYWNRQQKDDLLKLAGMLDEIEDITNRWCDHDYLTPRLRKLLRSGYSFINTAFKEIIRDMDIEQQKKLLASAKNKTIKCMDKDSDTEWMRKQRHVFGDDIVVCSSDTLADLAEGALCNLCKPCHRRAEGKPVGGECEVKKLYIELDIPPFTEKECECPWEIDMED